MRELDGIRIIGPEDGNFSEGPGPKRRGLISASETGGRWSLGEVTAEPDESVATHVHPGEPEAFLIVDGEVELHGAQGVAHLAPGDCRLQPARHRARAEDSERGSLAGRLAHRRARARQEVRRLSSLRCDTTMALTPL